MEKRRADENLLKPLEEQLRCRICSEFYSSCTMAICGHNFCSTCIRKRLSTDDDCPNCYEEIRESDLRSNKLLDKLVRFYKKIQRDKSSGNSETQIQKNSQSSHTDPSVQMILPQNTDQSAINSPFSATSQGSSFIHSLEPILTDLTYPIKLEVVESNEVELMSTDTVQESYECSLVPKRKNVDPIDGPRRKIFQSASIQSRDNRNTAENVDSQDMRFQKKVIKMLAVIHKDIKYLKRNSTVLPPSTLPQLPPGCNLPCSQPEDLTNLETLLKDQEFFDRVCAYLSSIGGHSVIDSTKRILNVLMTNDLSLQYNWKGSRGLKLAFVHYKAITSLILGAVRCNPHATAATEVEVTSVIKKWLMHAKDRRGGLAMLANKRNSCS